MLDVGSPLGVVGLGRRRESALMYQENDERAEFFLLLTVTKHFLHFF
jgi:hypothetical protein